MTKGLRLVGSGLRFARRRPRESWLLARAAGWVVVVSSLVKFLPLPRVLTLVSPRGARRPRSNAHVSDEQLVQLIDAMLAYNVLCFTPTCWKRAPVLHRYLALAGRETRIVFGLRKKAGTRSPATHGSKPAASRSTKPTRPTTRSPTRSLPPTRPPARSNSQFKKRRAPLWGAPLQVYRGRRW